MVTLWKRIFKPVRDTGKVIIQRAVLRLSVYVVMPSGNRKAFSFNSTQRGEKEGIYESDANFRKWPHVSR